MKQLQTLHSKFETFRMKADELIIDFFSRLMKIINKMRFHREKLEDVMVVEKVLRSLTPKFNFVLCAIEEFKDLDVLSIEEQ